MEEIFTEAPKSFNIKRKSPLAIKLNSAISDQLLLFLGDYTDDILAEYITVLVCNGKNQFQAKDDLEAFLGEKSSSFVSWLWGLLLQYEHACKGDSPSSCGEGRNLSRNKGKVNAPQSAYAGSSLTINRNYSHTSSRVHPYEVELSEITELQKISLGSSSKSETFKEQAQKHGSNNSKVFDTDEKFVKDTFSPSSATMGISQSFEDRSKLNKSGLAFQDPNFLRSELASNSLLAVTAERAGNPRHHREETYAVHVSARNPQSTLVEKPCQRKTSRVSVWDRLGKPHEEDSVMNDKSLAANIGYIVKKHYEAEEQPKVPPLVQNKTLSWRKQHILRVSDKTSIANCSEDRKHEPSPSTIVKPYTKENVQHKRTYSDISISPSPFPASSEDPSCVNSKKLNSSTEIGPLVPISQVKDVKLKLEQIEIEMSKLRSKQLEMSKERAPPVPSDSGVIKYPPEDVNSRTIFVSNVHFAATKVDLSLHFAQCGAVCNVTLTENVKGSAYLTFASKVSVEKAVALNGTSFFSRPLKVVRKGEEAMMATTNPTAPVKPTMDQKPAHKIGETNAQKPFNPLKVHRHHLQWRRNPIPPPSELSQASTAG